MKKFVIIALIFALAAGAAFAQSGSWSVSGQGEVGTLLNLAGEKGAKSQQAQKDADGAILQDNDKLKAQVGANAYNNLGYYGYIGGKLGLKYNIGALSAGIDFNGERTAGWISGNVKYADDTRAVEYVQDIFGGDGNFEKGNFAPERLWGYYKLLDGVIHLEAAYNGRDTNYWYITGYDGGVLDRLYNNRANLVLNSGDGWEGGGKSIHGRTITGLQKSLNFDDHFGRGFTKVDHHNYIVADLAPVDGLSIGIMMPEVFVAGSGKKSWYIHAGNLEDNSAANNNYYAQNDNKHVDFLDRALLQSRLGVKYGSGPITLAAQFALLGRDQKWEKTTRKELDLASNEITLTIRKPQFDEVDRDGNGVISDDEKTTANGINTGLYLEGKYNISDSISASLGFQGHFWTDKTSQLGFGAGVDFRSGKFGAGLVGGLYMEVDPEENLRFQYKKTEAHPTKAGVNNFTGAYELYEINRTNATGDDVAKNDYSIEKNTASLLGVKPTFTYQLVDNYLGASLSTSLYWILGVHERKYQDEVFAYEVTPELFFNVTGTGAGTGYYSAGNLIIIRYKIAGWVDGSEVRAMNKSHKEADVNTSKYFTRPVYNGVDITFKWSF